MFSFNKSHMNTAVKSKLLKAIISTKKYGHVNHVLNKKGHAFLSVRIAPSGLVLVQDQKGNNVKKHLLSWRNTVSFRNFIHNNLSNLY